MKLKKKGEKTGAGIKNYTMKNVLASKMTELRENKRLTLKGMAKKLGIDYRTLSRYEKEEQIPPATIVLEYSRIFNVTLDYLYYGVEISNVEIYNAIKTLSPKQRKAVMAIIDSYK